MKVGRVLYIAGEIALEYRWQHKQLSVQRYSAPQALLLQQRLTQDPAAALLLLDLPALEFRTDSLPAVRGEDLRQLRARRLERFFPSSPYCDALRVCPDPQDESRALWLFHGLALPESIEPWLTAVRASGSPLAGISALPLFAKRALQEMPHRPDQLLLIAGTPSGWRFIYFLQGQVLFSRVLPFGIAPEELSAASESLAEEIERTRQYLVAQRWLAHNEMLHVWLTPLSARNGRGAGRSAEPGGAGVLDFITARASGMLRITQWPLAQLIPQLALDLPQADGIHDWFARQLLNHWPPENHYAAPALRQQFLGRAVRRAAWVGGVAVFLAGAGSGAFALVEKNALEQQTSGAAAERMQLQQQLHQTTELLPSLPLPLPSLEARMQVLRMLQSQHAPVRALLLPVSQALTAQPAITLRSLSWKKETSAGEPAAAAAAWQVTLDARVEGSMDARVVQQEIEALQQHLTQRGFTVSVVRSPLNFNPDSALRSQLQRPADNPQTLRATLSSSDFSLALRWVAPGETP